MTYNGWVMLAVAVGAFRAGAGSAALTETTGAGGGVIDEDLATSS